MPPKYLLQRKNFSCCPSNSIWKKSLVPSPRRQPCHKVTSSRNCCLIEMKMTFWWSVQGWEIQPHRVHPLNWFFCLPSQVSHISYLQTLHRTHSNAGISALMAILCSIYHVPGLRNILKGISKSCPNCQRAYTKPLTHLMGLLPSMHTTPAPVFHHTGRDFAGPFYIKLCHTRKSVIQKVYACLFMCLASKTIHLDFAKDLSTKEFLPTWSRFINRRLPTCYLDWQWY